MHTEYPPLPNPPIKEAILQISVIPSDTYKASLLSEFIEAEKGVYPVKIPQMETVIQFMGGVNGLNPDIKEDKAVSGYKISSEDGLNLVQAHKDRVSVSRLEPYTSWDELFEEAQRVWEVYSNILKPKEIKGLSVRYINQFFLPPTMKTFEEYIDSTPGIPSELPQGVASFFVTYKLPDPESGAVAQVQLLFQGAIEDGQSSEIKIPIVFDTDVFKEIAVDSGDSETINAIFSQLHSYKNKIFFKTMKNKTMELFQ